MCFYKCKLHYCTSMPISWSTAEYEYYHFAMLRDGYIRRNAFIINDEFILHSGNTYRFSNKVDCRASFYMYLISRTARNMMLTIGGYAKKETRLIVPNQLFAPYRQHIFDEVADLDHLMLENPTADVIDLVVVFIPVQSIFIREILSTMNIIYNCKALVGHTEPIRDFSFVDGCMSVSHSASIIFAHDTFVADLHVSVSENNDVTLLNKSGLVIPSIDRAKYINGNIQLEYADHGLQGNCYNVVVTPCAVRAEVLHVISTDQSAQIILLDENGHKAGKARVSSVSTDTDNAQVTSYFVSDGIIHLRGSGSSYVVDIFLQTDTGKKKISAVVTPQIDSFVVGGPPPVPPYV